MNAHSPLSAFVSADPVADLSRGFLAALHQNHEDFVAYTCLRKWAGNIDIDVVEQRLVQANNAFEKSWRRLGCRLPSTTDELGRLAVHLQAVCRELDVENESRLRHDALDLLFEASLSLAGRAMVPEA